MNLVADVGGSNTRMALVAPDGGLTALQSMPTEDDLLPVLTRYLSALGNPPIECIACGGAGPVDPAGFIRLTNRALTLDAGRMAAAVGAQFSILINDLAAVAHALPALTDADLWACGGDQAVADSTAVVIAPGTGLGMAAGTWVDDRWWVLAGEAGHADMAPVDAHELQAWQALQRTHGRVSVETVLSGPGLLHLYAAIGGERQCSPRELSDFADAGDPLAIETRRLFTRWLGRVVGNLALMLDARAGVFIAGGIVPQWLAHFDRAEFRAGFQDKSPMSARLKTIPSWVITHPQPALLGLARLAAIESGAVGALPAFTFGV